MIKYEDVTYILFYLNYLFMVYMPTWSPSIKVQHRLLPYLIIPNVSESILLQLTYYHNYLLFTYSIFIQIVTIIHMAL